MWADFDQDLLTAAPTDPVDGVEMGQCRSARAGTRSRAGVEIGDRSVRVVEMTQDQPDQEGMMIVEAAVPGLLEDRDVPRRVPGQRTREACRRGGFSRFRVSFEPPSERGDACKSIPAWC